MVSSIGQVFSPGYMISNLCRFSESIATAIDLVFSGASLYLMVLSQFIVPHQVSQSMKMWKTLLVLIHIKLNNRKLVILLNLLKNCS